MPAPVFAIILFFLTIGLSVSLFIFFFESRSVGSFCAFIIFVSLTVGAILWMKESSEDLTNNPKIYYSETYELIFDQKAMKQYIITSGDQYINIAKVFGRSLPEGTKIRCDWYDRTRFGIDWKEAQTGKDPVLTYILPKPENTEKQVEKETEIIYKELYK